ncbi:hypothetical protein ACP46_gp75 [Rhizobium phage RHEph06]|uniref:Uncharacterized protein n=4 Tax=Kleczkowskavirus RHEph4 TaxID=1921526 RepID=A0A7S5USX7_9CAUD|nr:hypothetical protein ACP46_gp75 [Rhizobium phage RHEph06]YP_009598516.1 hypothetical protein FDH25_gp74 [Rhizobium phage RHEph04]AGC35836.1 hypothetical protein RHEph05_gp069 [Rhizobium phage RHEph05]QIG67701.1 hypothetical protein EVB51_084 [Rhizobium phage RHph_Y17]QIG69020.1 hypothetical protein EVB73_084 [Rhizobium phage RHph_Y3_43]QIG69569.1 hypothetical protein EVB80_086 [Rhizobium phage RHph_I36]QIG75443.1 hypothetical protein EVC17_086 [Rhizobium phage RHph_Y1_1]QIG75993.1 hypothe
MSETETPQYDLNQLLTQWDEAVKKVEEAKPWVEKERALRTLIFNTAFPNPERTQNAKRIDFGMALVGKPKINWTVDRALITVMLQQSNVKPIIEDVIDFAPKVRDGAWEKLSAEDQLLLAPALTAKPGTPELELRPQNKVKKYNA